ncbi:MAG: hypothetical protein R2911_31415 [Caldilineaceae bacterium]
MKLVNPANKRKYSIIVVGSGLAAAGPRPRCLSWATMSTAFAIRQPAASTA